MFRKVKEADGNLRDINEDKVLFERTDEDPMLVAITLDALSQANTDSRYMIHVDDLTM